MDENDSLSKRAKTVVPSRVIGLQEPTEWWLAVYGYSCKCLLLPVYQTEEVGTTVKTIRPDGGLTYLVEGLTEPLREDFNFCDVPVRIGTPEELGEFKLKLVNPDGSGAGITKTGLVRRFNSKGEIIDG